VAIRPRSYQESAISGQLLDPNDTVCPVPPDKPIDPQGFQDTLLSHFTKGHTIMPTALNFRDSNVALLAV
jgi:hypothetical protein